MKQVVILRGLPGSGKSYYAQNLSDDLVNGDEQQYLICSTDDYFWQNGEYQFDKNKLSEYHNLNLSRFIRALSQNIPLVIVDNTNIRRWEFIAYIEAANALGYQVKEVVVGDIKDKAMQHLYSQRNIHRVPLKVINKMAYQFEW
jgi:predicted kinase